MLSTAGHVRRVTNRRLRLAGRERRGDENSIHLIRLISRLEEAKTSHFRESISSHGADGDLLQPMRHRRANERKPFFFQFNFNKIEMHLIPLSIGLKHKKEPNIFFPVADTRRRETGSEVMI